MSMIASLKNMGYFCTNNQCFNMDLLLSNTGITFFKELKQIM